MSESNPMDPHPTVQLFIALFETAKEFSQKIGELEMEYIDEEKRLLEQRPYVENIRNGIAQAVINARDPNDQSGMKPRFTNDAARKAETEDRLSVHSVYREASAKLADMELAHRYNRVAIDTALRDYQLARLNYEAVAIGRRR